jgi:hypothetical protein
MHTPGRKRYKNRTGGTPNKNGRMFSNLSRERQLNPDFYDVQNAQAYSVNNPDLLQAHQERPNRSYYPVAQNRTQTPRKDPNYNNRTANTPTRPTMYRNRNTTPNRSKTPNKNNSHYSQQKSLIKPNTQKKQNRHNISIYSRTPKKAIKGTNRAQSGYNIYGTEVRPSKSPSKMGPIVMPGARKASARNAPYSRHEPKEVPYALNSERNRGEREIGAFNRVSGYGQRRERSVSKSPGNRERGGYGRERERRYEAGGYGRGY